MLVIARKRTDARYWCSSPVCLSVCLSVCHVPVLYQNGLTYHHTNILSSAYGSPIILVFPILGLNIFAKFRRGRNQGCHKGFLPVKKIFPVKTRLREIYGRIGRHRRCHQYFLPWKTIPHWNLCFRQRPPSQVSHMLPIPWKKLPHLKIYC